MTRYYVYAEDGLDPRSERPTARARVWAYPDDHKGPLQPEYTEVRIVPADAIVIESSELPKVAVWFPGEPGENLRTEFTQVTPSECGPNLIAHLEQEARERLAIAAHLREHPPVTPMDEAAVDALAAVIRAADRAGKGFSTDLARALIRAGYAKGGE
jgi:hypothetical protein